MRRGILFEKEPLSNHSLWSGFCLKCLLGTRLCWLALSIYASTANSGDGDDDDATNSCTKSFHALLRFTVDT